MLENTTSREDLSAEHGLSLWIETGGRRILFDMGQSDAFARNAERLGIDLGDADLAVLSHGHYDHGGGLGTFLARSRKAPVYLSRCAFEPHYHGAGRYIGLDDSLQTDSRLRFTGEEAVLDEDLALFSCNRRERVHALDTGGLQVMRDGTLQPEDFRHEQYLLVREGGKRVLFTGCSHKGVLQLMEWFRPDALVGGFHFSGLPADEGLTRRAEELDRFPAEYYTCHCTGCMQYAFLKSRMRHLQYLSCGTEITI